jgi:hypothetical protein
MYLSFVMHLPEDGHMKKTDIISFPDAKCDSF